ncbi:MAG TPA: hypothetical protein VNJ09_05945 [Chthonomonadales bacterium]|nr:hypothetical protein [Chthonomonadales bacterium]
MPDEKLPHRTLRTAFWLAALFTLVFGLRGQTAITFGLAIGAAIGLSSLWSLLFVVPRLFVPGKVAPRFWLGVLAFIKLPIYAVILYFAMSTPYINPGAVFAGVSVVPVVLVLKVLGYQLVQKTQAPTGDDTCRSKTIPSN